MLNSATTTSFHNTGEKLFLACLKLGSHWALNPFKPIGVKWLNFKVLRAILV